MHMHAHTHMYKHTHANTHICIRGVAKKYGTGRPADMVEDPQTSETHKINMKHIAMVCAKRHPATAIALLSRAPFVPDV